MWSEVVTPPAPARVSFVARRSVASASSTAMSAWRLRAGAARGPWASPERQPAAEPPPRDSREAASPRRSVVRGSPVRSPLLPYPNPGRLAPHSSHSIRPAASACDRVSHPSRVASSKAPMRSRTVPVSSPASITWQTHIARPSRRAPTTCSGWKRGSRRSGSGSGNGCVIVHLFDPLRLPARTPRPGADPVFEA